MHFHRPSAGTRALHVLWFAALAGVAGEAGCSGNNDSASSLFGSGSNVISTCQQICNNVLAQCPSTAGVYGQCTSACNDLILVPQSCLTQFAGYLACLGGATSASISCSPGGTTVTIAPGSCMSEEEAYATCNGGPSPISACIALPPSNTACGSSTANEGLGTPGKPVFCVGQPSGCTVSGSNPFGIGTYCCN